MYDYIVIGGGIVGLSTAWQLSKSQPNKKILLLEKESKLAQHQSGHNSGVIHSGIYYQPNSLKSRFCHEGNRLTKQFCQQHDIPYNECGKILVASNETEKQWMQGIKQRACKNLIPIQELSKEQLAEKEPNIQGISGILVPSTAVVDYNKICEKMAELFEHQSCHIELDTEVLKIKETHKHVTIETTKGVFSSKYLISCAGLMSDRLVKMLGIKPNYQIIPFRGEYYKLDSKYQDKINHLIYPIPNPELPFLGIHISKDINGSITVGPNAVLSLKREGYKKTDISLRDSLELFMFKGFWNLVRHNFSSGSKEMINTTFKSAYIKMVQQYWPDLNIDDFTRHPSGVRAQAVAKDGSMIDDFLFANSNRTLHVCNAPSPAATAALPIGKYVVDKINSAFKH